MISTAKVIASGRSQAIRLPKEFRIPGKVVRLTRVPGGILISEGVPWDAFDEACHDLGTEFLDAVEKRPTLQQALPPFESLPFDPVDCVHHSGQVRANLEAAGKTIGPLDSLAVAHGLALGATLVTHNTREFKRVSGLIVEDCLTFPPKHFHSHFKSGSQAKKANPDFDERTEGPRSGCQNSTSPPSSAISTEPLWIGTSASRRWAALSGSPWTSQTRDFGPVVRLK